MQRTLTAQQAARLIRRVEEEVPHFFADSEDIQNMFEALDDPDANGHEWFTGMLNEIQAA
jgi:hypothetical protein